MQHAPTSAENQYPVFALVPRIGLKFTLDPREFSRFILSQVIPDARSRAGGRQSREKPECNFKNRLALWVGGVGFRTSDPRLKVDGTPSIQIQTE